MLLACEHDRDMRVGAKFSRICSCMFVRQSNTESAWNLSIRPRAIGVSFVKLVLSMLYYAAKVPK